MKSRLPSDWAILPLGDLATAIQYGYTEKAQQEKVGPRFLRITDIQDDSVNWSEVPFCVIDDKDKEKYLLRQGDLVFARTGATVGKSFLITGLIPESVFASYLIRVRLRADIEPKYVSYFFRSNDYWRQISESQAGIGQPNVNGKKLAQIQIPVAPLDQQKSIVAEIEKQFSRLDEAVANLKRVKANFKRYKAAVLKAAVEGRLVEIEAERARREGRSYETGAQLLQRILETRRSQWQGKGKYKAPAAPDTADLPELPEGWVWTSVDQLVAHLTDGDHQAPPQTDEGIPFLVIGNVRSGEIDFLVTRHVGEAYYKSLDPYRQPKLGDLLYTLVGSYGIPVRVKTDKAFCIQRHMAILRPHEHSPMSYLTLAMASGNVFRQATAVATGTAQLTVPLAGLRKIAIPLPPIFEQKRIVAEVDRRLSILSETEAQVDANLQRAERLRQSILARAFSGVLIDGNRTHSENTAQAAGAA
jgi:type I restriction enzyme S subunit